MHSSWAGNKSIKVLASSMMGVSVLTDSSDALTIQKNNNNNRLQDSTVTPSWNVTFSLKKENAVELSEVRIFK